MASEVEGKGAGVDGVPRTAKRREKEGGTRKKWWKMRKRTKMMKKKGVGVNEAGDREGRGAEAGGGERDGREVGGGLSGGAADQSSVDSDQSKFKQ